MRRTGRRGETSALGLLATVIVIGAVLFFALRWVTQSGELITTGTASALVCRGFSDEPGECLPPNPACREGWERVESFGCAEGTACYILTDEGRDAWYAPGSLFFHDGEQYYKQYPDNSACDSLTLAVERKQPLTIYYIPEPTDSTCTITAGAYTNSSGTPCYEHASGADFDAVRLFEGTGASFITKSQLKRNEPISLRVNSVPYSAVFVVT